MNVNCVLMILIDCIKHWVDGTNEYSSVLIIMRPSGVYINELSRSLVSLVTHVPQMENVCGIGIIP